MDLDLGRERKRESEMGNGERCGGKENK